MIALALALLAQAASFKNYQVQNETTCLGKIDQKFETPDKFNWSSFSFVLSGAKAEVHATPAAKEGRLGVLAAVKDFSPETRANLEQFMASFKRAGANGIIVDGDSAYGVEDQDSMLTDLFTWLGAQELPVYAIIGNSESRSSFNRALAVASAKYPNVINLNLVRRVEGDGFTLVSLPGYYDTRFIHESAGCKYSADDAAELPRLARGAPSPVVLVTHGPPRQDGKAALDVTEDGHNVGDPDLKQAIVDAKINFGVFGHILEAGGRATDLEGKKAIKPGALSNALFLNPGPAFADGWSMNGGGISHGMAAMMILKDGKGEWLPLKANAPAGAKQVKYNKSK